MNNIDSKSNVKEEEIKKRLNDTLIQYFYSFGIETDSLDIFEFKEDKKYLEKNFKKITPLTQYPPFVRNQSNIDPNT